MYHYVTYDQAQVSQLFEIHLEKNQQINIEHKIETYTVVYKKLSDKEVTLKFPESYVPISNG